MKRAGNQWFLYDPRETIGMVTLENVLNLFKTYPGINTESVLIQNYLAKSCYLVLSVMLCSWDHVLIYCMIFTFGLSQTSR